MPTETFTIEPGQDDTRLDRLLTTVLGALSRSHIQRLIKDGQVDVDGKPAKANQVLKVGQRVTVNLPEPVASTVAAEEIDIPIVYQDEDIVVVDKPAGMVVHPAAGHASGTLDRKSTRLNSSHT